MDRGNGACDESTHVSSLSASPLKACLNTSAPISEDRMTSRHRLIQLLRFSRLASRAPTPCALTTSVPVNRTESANRF